MSERRYFLTCLIIITILGSALRVYHLIDIPFTYDELSAMHRTHYGSFHDLIKNGVAPDGHPAGVQVFLFYWTKLVGDAEWLIKLPFIMMGICCIPLIYRIGSRWFSRDAGIIAAALVACLQYTVMYSQIARPYISGLFLVLFLVVVWNEVMVKITWRNLIIYAVLLALCAYNHYFSLLMAGCIALTGFFVIERKQLLKYKLSVFLALVLFAPHVPLFFAQLKLKGLGWIAAPHPGFFKYYLNYVFNFSPWVIAAIIFFVVQGFCISIRQNDFGKSKYRIIALLWFVVSAAIGYFYSVYRAPVLQTSVLIFSFPFLVLFITSFVRLPGTWLRSAQISALLLVLTTSLIYGRNYYNIFYHQETEMFAKHISAYQKAFGNTKVAAVVRTEASYLDYYKSKYKTGWAFATFDSIGGNIAWRKWLEKSDAEYLILCNPPIEWGVQYLAAAKEYFPCIDSVYNGFTTDIYILKRDSALCKPVAKSLFYFSNNSTTISSPPPYKDDKGMTHFIESSDWQLFKSLNEPAWLNEKAKLDISFEVHVDSVIPKGTLTLKFIGKTGEILQTRESSIESFVNADTGWHAVYLTARLYHSPVANPKNKPEYVVIDLLHDPTHPFNFRNFRFEANADNPVLYWLIRN